MNRKAVLSIIAVFILFGTLNFASAYYYNGGNYGGGMYDSYSYHSARSQGSQYGSSYVKTNDYNRYTSEQILPDGSIEKTTHYMTTRIESPNYYQGYGRYYTYPAYSNYNYGNYQYDNYPWYRRYWEDNNMNGMYGNMGGMQGNYMPRMQFSGYAW